MFHDDVDMLLNDDADADANMVSLDTIPFDNEIVDGVDNDLLMEQASGPVHREPTTPSQPDVEVYASLYTLVCSYVLWALLFTTYDMQKDQTTTSQQIIVHQGYANVVGPTDKTCLDSIFSNRKSKKIQKKKKKPANLQALARNFYLITSPEKQDELSTNFNPVNVQRGRVTRASCSRKESIDPIVVSQVMHRITLIFTSISGWSLLMYVMYVMDLIHLDMC